VVTVPWDIVAVVSVEAVVPVNLQSFVTTHLRPLTSVAVAVENFPPKWILLLVKLLRSSRDLNQHDDDDQEQKQQEEEEEATVVSGEAVFLAALSVVSGRGSSRRRFFLAGLSQYIRDNHEWQQA
jgi:hypothetical protein